MDLEIFERKILKFWEPHLQTGKKKEAQKAKKEMLMFRKILEEEVG